MDQAWTVELEDRGLLRLDGRDRRDFLQGLISNDVDRIAADRAIWAAFLTPQGKYLHDFFLAAQGDSWLLDCEAARRGDLLKRLKLYRLRSQVELSDASDALAVFALWGDGALPALGLSADSGAATAFAGGIAFVDPRLPALGARLIAPRDAATAALAQAGFATGARADHDRIRIGLGLPDGSRDMEVERAILLENGFDELHGVDWDKSCYMGQELTARTKYRALIKKRLLPVEIDGPAPEPGTTVRCGDRDAGTLRSVADGLGLALLRLEFVDDEAATPLTAGAARLIPRKPDWASF